jgi:hypothetical protein
VFRYLFIDNLQLLLHKENVEYCLLDDQTDRLTKIKAERHDIEMVNNDLRKKLNTLSEKVFFFILFYLNFILNIYHKMIVNQFEKNMTTVVRFAIFIHII